MGEGDAVSNRVKQIGDCTLYLADCMEILPTLGKVDAVVTDPPYGIGEAAGKNKSRGNAAVARDYGNKSWDDAPPDKVLIDLLREVSKHQVIFGGNYFELPPTSCWLLWDKQNGGNDFADCEMAWTNLQKAVRRIYWRWNGMIRKGDDIREHPTQKPVGVMEWCIGHLPDAAQTILDPFMGSGTTGVACVKMGRKFIGIEREPEYFEIACRRIEQAYAQPDMFIQQTAEPMVQEIML
jgi:DNA modification methylase